MLGRKISDPFCVESPIGEAEGLGLLDSETVLGKEKNTFQITGNVMFGKMEFIVKGYEIHMGETTVKGAPFAAITERNGLRASIADGCSSSDGKIHGTYIHGIFDNDGFREALLEGLGAGAGSKGAFNAAKEASLTELARLFEDNVAVDDILRVAGL
jgi:adenosylcobyric acid synthase